MLPGVVVEAIAKAEVNLPKVAIEFVFDQMADQLDLPSINLKIGEGALAFDYSFGNPGYEIPTGFDIEPLINFITGLVGIVEGLPDLLPVPTKVDLIDLITVALGLPGEPALSAEFKEKFAGCLAQAMLDVLVP